MGLDRVQRDHLPRGAAGHPGGAARGGEIDGAGRFITFWRIVWPLLGPATLFVVVWSSINALQVFDEIYVSTRGGPLQATTVVVYYLYQQTFEFFAAGYGAAIAYVLFVAILVLTLLQLWIGQPAGALHVVSEGAIDLAARCDEQVHSRDGCGGRARGTRCSSRSRSSC